MAAQDPQTDTTTDTTTDTSAATTDPTAALPDYVLSPNAVFKDEGVQWRYGKAPDYTKTRKEWEEGRRMHHPPGSLEEIVENLVKNWEVEASFKPRLQDWRTIDHENYSFAMGGGPPSSAEHMIKVGTYNGIIAPNEYYSPENSDFASSHKTFKRMMPTFAWEVLEVYSGPPRVAFRWRHWGFMKNDYVGFNDKGERVTAKAHGGIIDIEGVIVATVDDKLRLQDLQTWMDPLEMFRQIAPQGVVNKQAMNHHVDMEAALDAEAEGDGTAIAKQHDPPPDAHEHDQAPEDVIPKHVSESTGEPADAVVLHQGTDAQQTATTAHTDASSAPAALEAVSQTLSAAEKFANSGAQAVVEAAVTPPVIASPPPNYHEEASAHRTDNQPLPTEPQQETAPSLPGDVPVQSSDDSEPAASTPDAVAGHLDRSAEQVHPQRNDVEEAVAPAPGEAVAAAADGEETRVTHEEMSRIEPSECPFLMNRE